MYYTKSICARPAIHQLVDLKTAVAHPWGWVKLAELFTAAGISGPAMESVLDLWIATISKDQGVLGVAYDGDFVEIGCFADLAESAKRHVAADVNPVFVPAGFASDVLEELRQQREGCAHRIVDTIQSRIGCSDAGCSNDEHFCHTRIEYVCARCGTEVEVVEL